MIAAPPGSSPSKISLLASAIAATEGKNSRCAGATVVIRATCGRTCRVRARISPAWFMPISSTPKLRPRRQTGQAQRHAPMIVVAGGAGVGGRLAGQHMPQRLLGAGLADAAGDAGDPGRRRGRVRRGRGPPAPPGCRRRMTAARRRPRASGTRLDHGRRRARARTPGRRRRGRRCRRRVSATNRSPGASVRLSIETPDATQSPATHAPGGRGDVLGGPQGAHTAVPPARRAASRNTSASSNGRVRSPTIW